MMIVWPFASHVDVFHAVPRRFSAFAAPKVGDKAGPSGRSTES